MVSLTIARSVGRLVEARCAGNPDEAKVAEWRRQTLACVGACVTELGKRVVSCADLRASALIRPAVAEDIIALMRDTSHSVERSAVVCTGGATFTLQLQRIVREGADANHQPRRIFTDAGAAFAWLDEVLDPAERVRVRQFIAEFQPSAAETALNTLGHLQNGRAPRGGR